MKKHDREYIQKRIEFSKALTAKIFPKIAVYEKLRVKYLIIVVLVTLLCLAASGYILYIYWGIDSDLIQLAGLFLIVPFILYSILKHNLADKFNRVVMRHLCSVFGDLKWKKNNKNSNDILYEKALVIPHYDESEHDDYFYGNYKNVEIIIDESKYQKRYRDSKGRTRYETIFQGLVIQYSFNKKFESHTIVKNDALFHISPAAYLRHTELEDVVFEKKYDVFTNDEIDARYILTTAFMERLNNLSVSFKNSKMICSFYDNALIISFDTRKDMFAMGSLFQSVLNVEQYYIIFDEFYSILRIVDVLNLDTNVCL